MARTPNSPKTVDHLPQELSDDSFKGEQLRTHLTNLLDSLGTGALLPSERVLAERMQVARGTVRQQLDALAAQGRVKRVPGRGTFVSEPRFLQTPQMSSFSRDMLRRGMRPSSKVLSAGVGESDELIATKLQIPAGASVFHVERIRYADDEPMALELTHLPAERFPDLASADLSRRSLYEVLETNYGCRMDAAEQRVSVITLSAAEARSLNTRVRSPAFVIERVTRDTMGNVVECGRTILRGDRYDIQMHVEA